MTGRWDAWTRVAVVSHLVLGLASALVVVAMMQAGSSTWVVVIAVLAVATLHLALHVARSRATRAFGIATAAMVALAIVPMPGWSTGAVLPSAGCFLLVSWRVTTTAAPPWPRLTLGGGVVGVVLTESLAVARLGGTRVDVVQLLEAGVLLAVVVGTWAAARYTRAARARKEAHERGRVATARLAERANIRRDLHDVVGHSLALMIAQAEAARVGVRDEATREALSQVAETGRGALGGLRAMLRVLDAAASGTATLPALDALPSLIEAASTPLHAVTLVETGARGVLTSDAELALVRVAQEGITNALKHLNPPVAVEIRLTWSSVTATLEVCDDGGVGLRPGADAGSGLIALAERVTAAGGAFDVERNPDSWRLRAVVPARISPTMETTP
jgi:signal transduction histidine kinase